MVRSVAWPTPISTIPRSPNRTHGRFPSKLHRRCRRFPLACPAGNVVTFNPGTYTDADALTNLMNGTTCPGRVFWFKPGAYYFNFTNTASGSNRVRTNGPSTMAEPRSSAVSRRR